LFGVGFWLIQSTAYIVHFEIIFHHEKKIKLIPIPKVKIFNIHQDFIENIMTRAEWICNDCNERFETKGKRDGHRERTHRQTILIDFEKHGMCKRGVGEGHKR
jgi:hypothetical protein